LEEEEEEERPAKEATMPKLRREDKKDKDEKQEPSLGFRFNREETFRRIYLYAQFISRGCVSFFCVV
tara:strand:+ start:590 stop:790 length:201 start_codon:yes stop_codon:yes gene_type:complete